MSLPTAGSDPRVGVAAIIQRPDGRVIFGRRKGSHGAGKWALPGGHLEYGEDFAACAERETLEETGLKVKGVRLVNATNDVFADLGRHYITLFVVCELLDPAAEPQNLEPHKCEEWVWMSWEEFKQIPNEDLFLPMQHLLERSSDIRNLATGLGTNLST